MDNNYFDLKEYCENPTLYENLIHPDAVYTVVSFIQNHNGIIDKERQFVKRIDEYLRYCGYPGGDLIQVLQTKYPDIFNSEENKDALRNAIEKWY